MKGSRRALPFILAAALMTGCGVTDAARERIGSLVLLEGRNPAYYEQLSPQTGLSFPVPEHLSVNGRTKNLILSGEHYVNHDGFSAEFHEDGSVTVSGMNEENKIYLMIYGHVPLPAGSYTLFDGGVSAEDGSYYLQAVAPEGPVATLPGANHFFLSEDQTVGVYIAVEAGVRLDGVTFYPEICFRGEENDVYDPCPGAVIGASGTGRRALLFQADREALKNLSEDDRILFDNNLSHMYKGRFDWVSLLFEDGTGVQIIDCDPDQAVYGKMDIFGRVYRTSGT